MSADTFVTTALSQVRRAAETARSTIGALNVAGPSQEEVTSRLQAAAAQLALLKSTVTNSSLRYQALHPILVPDNPSDLPVFLKTLKDASEQAKDSAAEKRGRKATKSSHDHNSVIDKEAIPEYDRQATEAVEAMRATHASRMEGLIRVVAEKKLAAMAAAGQTGTA